MKRFALLLPVALAACSADPRLSEGLKVTVQVEPSSLSQCVRVLATPETGTPQPSRAIPRKDSIVVAVYRAKDWSGAVTLVARGYASCDDASDTFIEESAAETRETYDGEVTLKLVGKPTVVDTDGDGY